MKGPPGGGEAPLEGEEGEEGEEGGEAGGRRGEGPPGGGRGARAPGGGEGGKGPRGGEEEEGGGKWPVAPLLGGGFLMIFVYRLI